MNISDLIIELQQKFKEFGNVNVEICLENEEGESMYGCAIEEIDSAEWETGQHYITIDVKYPDIVEC